MSLNRFANLPISISLNDEDNLKKVLEVIKNVLDQNNSEQLKNLAELLSNLSYRLLIRMCQIESNIEAFCRTNSDFISFIKKKLNLARTEDLISHPSMDIQPLNKNKHDVYQVFDLYLAASYMQSFNDSPRGSKEQ